MFSDELQRQSALPEDLAHPSLLSPVIHCFEYLFVISALSGGLRASPVVDLLRREHAWSFF